ncbi:MAG: Rieske 2Fe-2S domain-containing protein [Chloroflexi bacterium]|nr:Rieske 2Fe-2S domain-containing protein [Chloroflexota bacterium]
MLQVVDGLLEQATFLEQIADKVQEAIGQALQAGGDSAKRAKDVLNGVWFEHPLHPAMTDIPIGAWTCATMLDIAGPANNKLADAADLLVGVGCLGAVGAAVTGLADWQDTYGKERRTGLAHAMLNSGALSLFLLSLPLRRKARPLGVLVSLAGYGLALTASYLGGDLVFRMGTQVNRTAWLEGPEEWTRVLPESELGEGTLVKGEAAGLQLLMVRQGDRIYAMSNVCPHAGGPLNEGSLEGISVVCPWHGSQFELVDGAIVHGPASVQPPVFETRVQDGQVEVRRKPAS